LSTDRPGAAGRLGIFRHRRLWTGLKQSTDDTQPWMRSIGSPHWTKSLRHACAQICQQISKVFVWPLTSKSRHARPVALRKESGC